MSHLGPQFANIMVEFETDTREMAVDVPDSFIGISKTPPKYPPPRRRGDNNQQQQQQQQQQRSGGVDDDGNNESFVFPVLREETSPTPKQSLRIQKYSEELKRNMKNEENNLLLLRRRSLNSKNKMNMEEEEEEEDEDEDEEDGDDSEDINQILRRLRRFGECSEISTIMSSILQSKDFQNSLQIHNKIKRLDKHRPPPPTCFDAQDVAADCLSLEFGDDDPDFCELTLLLQKLKGLLYAHDKIARHMQLFKNLLLEEEALLDRLSHYSEPNIKIVKIEKSNEPLGATVKNEDDAVIIGRILRGGVAERSGLIHEGDEILEVNEIELRGRNVNEVCDILTNMSGTLTLLVVPARNLQPQNHQPTSIMHVKSHIDYDPEDDPYVPCRELGISFQKGDILHVINQQDPHWWQAFRDGEDDQSLAGLIPSASFQQQREAMKQTIAHDSEKYGGGAPSGFLCAKKSGRRKKRRKVSYIPDTDEDPDEILTFEEVVLYYPRADRPRPVVLIGPPNIGRHELRQKLMQNSDRFAAAIPHTSRPKRPEEIDAQDYHFISRLQFEQDILARKFVEHGEYEKSYYGTSLEAIRTVIHSGKICVLNLHPQSLKILKHSDLMPFVVFVVPPSLEKLKRWKNDHSELPVPDDELKEIIERAREMEETYGQYFDMVITYSDPERAYQQLLTEINLLEREPQWVPKIWQRYFQN